MTWYDIPGIKLWKEGNNYLKEVRDLISEKLN